MKIEDKLAIARANTQAIKEECEGLRAALKRETSKVTAANARERKAFMAGFKAATTTPPGMFGRDEEQEWQQYRCQDETDWKVVSGKDAAKIDALVLETQK